MTKYLVKIISICAFVVLIPVIIAGVALSAIGSTIFNLDVYVVAEAASGASYSLSIGETTEKKEGLGALPHKQVSYLNGTDLSVNLELTGYDFEGWFNGDDKTYTPSAQPLSDKANYDFTLTKDTQITALLKLKTFTLNFNGIDEGVSVTWKGVASSKEEINGKVFKYGDELPELSTAGQDKFAGWKIIGYETETSFNSVLFPEEVLSKGTYTLVPSWENRMQVVYYKPAADNTWTSFEIKNLAQNDFASYKLLDGTDPKVVEALGQGYEFAGWTDQESGDGSITDLSGKEFKSNSTINIYLKRNVIKYTVSVKKFAESETQDTKPLTFDVEKKYGKDSLTAQLKRNYYTLSGLTYGGKDYLWNEQEKDFVNQNDDAHLSEKIFTDAKSGDHTVEAVAIWTCDFDQLTINYSAAYKTALNDRFSIYGKEGDQYTLIRRNGGELGAPTLYFNDTEGHEKLNLEDNMFEYFIKSYEGYYYNKNAGVSDSPEYVKVKLESIDVSIDGNDPHNFPARDGDFAYAIELLEGKGFSSFNAFTITFVFTEDK